MQDVIIIGGGVIGLSLARELAGQGVHCAVLDQAGFGAESSWAGAGILPPGCPQQARSAEARIRAASHVLWPGLSASLRDETGIDNGFRRCGGLELRQNGPADELDGEIEQWRREGVDVAPLAVSDVAQFEAQLSPRLTAAYRLPDMGQVRNPRHVKALEASCARRGVRLYPGTPVSNFERSGERIIAVETPAGRLPAGQFVIASGAWSSRLLAEAGCRVPIRPLRGQIVLLAMTPGPLSHVVNVGTRYLVPRGDGRTLVGSTEEVAGFDKRTTAKGIGGLIEFGLGVVPRLSAASVERTWAGLRPQSPDGLPFLGRVPAWMNLFVAAGHFRAGLQLSPITAVLLAQVLLGKPTTIAMEPYAVDRRQTEFMVPGGH